MAIASPPSPLAAPQKLSVKHGSAAYAMMRRQVHEEGILERSYGYYAFLMAFTFIGFAGTVFAIIATPASWLLVGWCVALAFFMVQLAGLLHDAGHRAIFATVKMNDIIGHFVGAISAMPFADWRTSHNQHHAHPNEEDEDPDIELPFISLSTERYLARTGLARLLAPYQRYLWYPFSAPVSVTKRLYGFAYFRRQLRKNNAWEFTLYLTGLFLWFAAPFLVFDFAKAMLVFFVANGVAGFYMANIFAPNHKGMPYIYKGQKLSFIEQQVITSRNIAPGFITDILYVGLNYQIEHHLFPNCPRNKLKLLTPHVLRACAALDLPYTEVGILESQRILLGELQRVADEAEKVRL